LSNSFISSVWDFTGVTPKETGYFTHDFLRWYGKLIPQLVEKVVSRYSEEGDLVLANFSGSGTVALEASLLGRNVIGVDANPLAMLVARVKTNPFRGGVAALLPQIRKSYLQHMSSLEYGLGALSKWFHSEQDRELLSLAAACCEVPNPVLADYLALALASSVKKSLGSMPEA